VDNDQEEHDEDLSDSDTQSKFHETAVSVLLGIFLLVRARARAVSRLLVLRQQRSYRTFRKLPTT
jgi:hypothetical protein